MKVYWELKRQRKEKDSSEEPICFRQCHGCESLILENFACPDCNDADSSTGQNASAHVGGAPVVARPDSASTPERYLFFCCRCLALAFPLFFPRRWHRAPWMRLYVSDMRTGAPPPVNAFQRFFSLLSLFFLRRPEGGKTFVEEDALLALFPGVAADGEEDGAEPVEKRHRACEQDEYREPSVEY